MTPTTYVSAQSDVVLLKIQPGQLGVMVVEAPVERGDQFRALGTRGVAAADRCGSARRDVAPCAAPSAVRRSIGELGPAG